MKNLINNVSVTALLLITGNSFAMVPATPDRPHKQRTQRVFTPAPQGVQTQTSNEKKRIAQGICGLVAKDLLKEGDDIRTNGIGDISNL